MVRKRLWPPSSSFCSDCRSCVTRPTGTKAANDFTATSSVSIALRQHRDLADRRAARTAAARCRSSWILPTLSGQPFERRRDHAGQEIDDDDLPAPIAIRPKIDQAAGCCDSKAPVKSASGVMMKSCHFLPKSAGRVDRLATYSLPPRVKVEHALAVARTRAEGDRRQLVVERRDVAAARACRLRWRRSCDRSEAAITRP